MISEHSQNVARRAKAIYAEKLQTRLEIEASNQFVAIEPESEEHFVAESFSPAVAAARKSHPDRISFVIRIRHEAALHIGGISNDGKLPLLGTEFLANRRLVVDHASGTVLVR